MTQDSATGSPPMIGRRLSITDWLAYIAAYPLPASCTRLVVHHTYIPTAAQWQGLSTLRGIQRFYGDKGWTAAPHLFVAPDGIWLFTPLNQVGIHAGVGNSGYSNGKFWYSIGMEMVGDFDTALPNGAVWEGAKAVMGGVSRKNGIAPRQLLSLHRDYTNQKSCPGWAVTREWVWEEAEAWLNNTKVSNPPPPGPIGTPTPSNERLLETLMNETYKRRAEGYNSDWSLHQIAVQRGLGAPIARANDINVENKNWEFQVFARDTIYNEIPNWGDVHTMSDLLGGSIPPAGIGRGLLEATFLAGGTQFHPERPLHQYAFAARLGPPLGDQAQLVVDNVTYIFQPFAVDTLYSPANAPTTVQQLSALARATDPAQVRLRDALLAQVYTRAGTIYHPDWAFHQVARNLNLGTPLSRDYQVQLDNTTYNLQVYALDTLYNIVPNWGDVRRLSALAGTTAAIRTSVRAATPGVLSVDSTPQGAGRLPMGAQPSALYAADAQLAPPQDQPFAMVQYAPDSPAQGSRSGGRITLLVLHGDAGPAATTLAQMTAPPARGATHYYIDSTGTIFQLVPDARAAWHSGLANWQGRRQNINRISIGITLEHRAGQDYAHQFAPLRWLVSTLMARYHLSRDALVLWSNLAPKDAQGESSLSDLPLADVVG